MAWWGGGRERFLFICPQLPPACQVLCEEIVDCVEARICNYGFSKLDLVGSGL